MADFNIEIDLDGGVSIQYTISEEEIRNDPIVSKVVRQTGDTAEIRKSLRWAVHLRLLRTLSVNLTEPITVVDGSSTLWLIPIGAIRAMRMRDPQMAGDPQPFSFLTDEFHSPGP
jgi:hypothetical protein